MTPTNGDLDRQVLELDARQGEAVLRDVFHFLGRFVAYPSEHAHTAHALWIMHTHLMDRWDSTPRLAFLSPESGSGKSRALEATELLVPQPVMAVNVSPAYLFRKVGGEDGPPTILYDEIDTVFGPKAADNEEIRALLNAGHRRGATAGRCVLQGKTVLTEELPAYAAVALAGLGSLPNTITSRAVIVRMQRRRVDERVEPFRRRLHQAEGDRLRQRIEIWARQQPDEIEWPVMPAEVQDRDADVWEALLAIASLVGGGWPARARTAAVVLVAASKEAEPSLGIRLLSDTKTVFGDRKSIASKTLVQALIEMDEAPRGNLNGRPLDNRGLAHRLRQYGIRSKTVRTDSGSTPKGYSRSDFEDVWRRYLSPVAAISATSATTFDVQGPSSTENVACGGCEVAYVADVAKAAKAIKENDLKAVAAVAHVADISRWDGRRCDHCGQPATSADPLHSWDWDERPDGILLHSRCEEPWHDAGRRPDDYPELPAFLRRVPPQETSGHAPALPVDDSLDDFQ
jgi:hypothetical protein